MRKRIMITWFVAFMLVRHTISGNIGIGIIHEPDPDINGQRDESVKATYTLATKLINENRDILPNYNLSAFIMPYTNTVSRILNSTSNLIRSHL